jgi:hypothetical protein
MFHLKRVTKNLKFWNNWAKYNQFKVLLSNKDITRNEYLVLEHLDTFKNFTSEHHTSRRSIAPFIACDLEATALAIKGLVEKGYIKETKVNHHYYHYELLIIDNLESDFAKANASKYFNGKNDATGNPDHCATGNPDHCATGNPVHIVIDLEENIDKGNALLFFGKEEAKHKAELMALYQCDESKLVAVLEYYHNLYPAKKTLYRIFRKCIGLGEFETYYTRLRESQHQANREKEDSSPVDLEGINQMVSEQDDEGPIIDLENISVTPQEEALAKQAIEEMMLNLKKQMIINEVELTD